MTSIPTTPVPKVEYDGYYLIDVVARNGFCLIIPTRGYNLKSWLNFEQNLGSTVQYRAVSEQEWMKLHWTQTPYEEDSPGFDILARKAAKKKTEKAAAKTKPVAKKPVKKTTKKVTPKPPPAKK